MEYALKLENVSKTYKASGFSLRNVSMEVPAGSIVGFVGENGAGKSTTIGCILNTLFRDGGSVKIFGEEMSDKDTGLRERIGVVYDGDNFPGYYSARQVASVMRGIYRQWDDALFSSYLSQFGLDPSQKIKTYSKGMTMKLAVAAALSHHPDLLILDEATSGLDPAMREEILDIFLDFIGEEERAVLLSSHITTDLERIADYITFIHEGRILLTEEKDEILYRYGILRCEEDTFAAMDKRDWLAWRRRGFQFDVLVKDRRAAARKYAGEVIDHASIEETMLLLAKGERNERIA